MLSKKLTVDGKVKSPLLYVISPTAPSRVLHRPILFGRP